MRRWVCGCLLLAAAACGSGRLDAKRSAVQDKLAAFEAVGELLKQPGPLSSTSLDVPDPAPSFPPCFGKENAVVIGAESFNDLSEPSSPSRLVPLNPIGGVACWARKGVTPLGKKPDVGDYLQRVDSLLRLRYVLVVRTLSLVEPTVGPHPGEFTGGSCRAEALLFNLDQKRFLGAMEMEGSNFSKVTVPSWVGNVPEYLMENLREVTFAGAREDFKKRFPQADPPFRK